MEIGLPTFANVVQAVKDDCLGLPSLMLLSLIAKADPEWTMPMALCRAAVTGAIRTAKSAPSQPWLGFVERSDEWWRLEAVSSIDAEDEKACNLRNILRAAQTAVGGRIAWGKWSSFVGDASAAAVLSYLNVDKWDGSYLNDAPKPLADATACLQLWQARQSILLNTNQISRTNTQQDGVVLF